MAKNEEVVVLGKMASGTINTPRQERRVATSTEEELANHCVDLLTHKERLAYWAIRLLSEADPMLSTDSKLGTLTALADMHYDNQRCRRMLQLGEPGRAGLASRETVRLSTEVLAALAEDTRRTISFENRKTMELERTLPPADDPIWKLGRDLVARIQRFIDGKDRA